MTDYIPYNHHIHQHDEKIKAEYAERRTADLADEVPDIDREVIALTTEGKVVFAHRHAESWKGENLETGEVTTHYPKRYDAGGWNQPDVKW